MKNQRVRNSAQSAGVRLWEIADRYGVAEGTFIRKLRYQLPPEEEERILLLIEDLAREKGGEAACRK